MSFRAFLTCCLAFLAFTITASAGDLNAPAAQPVTVRSEIERGYAAALDAVADVDGPSDVIDAVLKVGKKNEQERTASDAFMLGMCFGEWRTLWRSLSMGTASRGSGKNRVDESGLAASFADAAHSGFRTWAKKCDLSDEQLKEALGSQTYDAALDEPAWAEAVKTKQFKGTMPGR